LTTRNNIKILFQIAYVTKAVVVVTFLTAYVTFLIVIVTFLTVYVTFLIVIVTFLIAYVTFLIVIVTFLIAYVTFSIVIVTFLTAYVTLLIVIVTFLTAYVTLSIVIVTVSSFSNKISIFARQSFSWLTNTHIVVKPLKALLPEYSVIEAHVSNIIAIAFNLGDCCHPAIKRADLIALATEKRDLMPNSVEPWIYLAGIEALPIPVRPMSPQEAKLAFIKRFTELQSSRAIFKF